MSHNAPSMTNARATGWTYRVMSLVFCFSACCVGCSEPTSKVMGTVTFEGRPLLYGTVNFYDSQGGIHRAEISKGRYVVEGVPVGDVKVAVVSMKQYLAKEERPDPVETLEMFEGGSGKTLSDGVLTEDELRSMFGPPLEEQPPETPQPSSITNNNEPRVNEEDLSHIPMRYVDITTSDLKCTVTLPETVYDIILEREATSQP